MWGGPCTFHAIQWSRVIKHSPQSIHYWWHFISSRYYTWCFPKEVNFVLKRGCIIIFPALAACRIFFLPAHMQKACPEVGINNSLCTTFGYVRIKSWGEQIPMRSSLLLTHWDRWHHQGLAQQLLGDSRLALQTWQCSQPEPTAWYHQLSCQWPTCSRLISIHTSTCFTNFCHIE